MGGLEIFNCCRLKAFVAQISHQSVQQFLGPDCGFPVFALVFALVIADGRAIVEVIHQVGDHVGAANLFGEAIIITI